MGDKIFQRSVPVRLTTEEYVEKGKAMSREQNEMTTLTARLKEVSADFKAKIAQKEATINSLSITISNGYEYREVDCFYFYRPKDGKKDIVRGDTGETIGTETMTKTDFQEQLPLEQDNVFNESGPVVDAIMIEDKTGEGTLDDPKVYKLEPKE